MLVADTLLQDRYRVLRPIGRGSTGAVYRALDQRLDQPVALKQILRHGPHLRKAFEREARLLAALRHPALPKVTDFFVEPAGQFLVMEYIPGDDLAEAALRRIEPFAPRRVLDWTFQLLDALTYLHEQEPPILHRDIKPHNLKLVDGTRIVLLDFGLAQDTSGPPDGEDVGGYTPCYASLEQIQGRSTDPRSDLYALAASVYDLLTGVKPPDPRRRRAALQAGQADPLQPAHVAQPTVPAGVSEVLQKGMALRPKGRFASARDMRLALEAALERRAAVPHNLPAQTSPLVGRGDEIRAVRRAFLQEGARLLTLTGPGGVGKTRLGLQIATTLLEDFDDGVFFVPLAPLRDPDLVVSRLASSLGVKQGPGEPLRQQVQAWLGNKRTLLLFDNFEHLLDAALLVSDLLAACPGLKVLATSREALNLRGERTFPVPPLAVPDPAGASSPTELLRYDALQLFSRRARAARPGFVLDEVNATNVAEICVRLDGLPLAIELAAVHVQTLSAAEILARLSRRFELLRHGPRDLPARQQTLRATLDWSHALLKPEEQKLFRRLAVFVGGFTSEAVSAVCCPAEKEDLTPLQMDVVAGLASLTDKHLLQREVSDPPRYTMLVTVQAYAAERLTASGEQATCERTHTTHYLTWAERVAPELRGTEQVTWLDRLALEHDNLRAALAWSLQHGETALALRMGEALWRFWYQRGHLYEGRQWLARILAQDDQALPEARAELLNGAAVLAKIQGDFGQARAFFEQSLALKRRLGDRRGAASVLHNLGILVSDEGEYGQAEAFLEESLALKRRLEDGRGIALTLNALGTLADSQGRHGRAQDLFEESLAQFRAADDKWGAALAQGNLGMAALYQADYGRAKDCFEGCLALFEALGDKSGVAIAVNNLGLTALRRGDLAEAQIFLRDSLKRYRELGARDNMAFSLEGLASVASGQGQPKRAARLFGAAAALRARVGAPLPPADRSAHERDLAAVRAALSDEAFDAAWAESQAWSLERAVDYALET